MSLDDDTEYIRVCLYGEYGTGKTSALAAGANLGPTHIIDTEQRLKASPLRRLGIPTDRIEAFRDIRFEAILQHLWDIKGKLYDEPGSIAVVGIDTIEDLVKTMLGTIIDESVQVAIRQAERRGEVVKINPMELPDDAYNIMTEQVRRFLRLMRDLDCHLMFTSHERRDKAEDRVMIGPSASPAVQADIMGYVDVLGHTGYDQGTYVARFEPGTKYAAKDVFGLLPKVMADPTLPRIVAYTSGRLTIETDPIQQAYQEEVDSRNEAARNAAQAAGVASAVGREPRPRRSRSAT